MFPDAARGQTGSSGRAGALAPTRRQRDTLRAATNELAVEVQCRAGKTQRRDSGAPSSASEDVAGARGDAASPGESAKPQPADSARIAACLVHTYRPMIEVYYCLLMIGAVRRDVRK